MRFSKNNPQPSVEVEHPGVCTPGRATSAQDVSVQCTIIKECIVPHSRADIPFSYTLARYKLSVKYTQSKKECKGLSTVIGAISFPYHERRREVVCVAWIALSVKQFRSSGISHLRLGGHELLTIIVRYTPILVSTLDPTSRFSFFLIKRKHRSGQHSSHKQYKLLVKTKNQLFL